MNESAVWQYLKRGMMGLWQANRIESSAGNGVPDVCYSLPGKHVWIELKYIKAWPVRATTKVKLPLRPEQKLWISVRGKMSGNVWVFIRIYDTFYLLNHDQAIDACDGWTHDEWAIKSTLFWYKKIDFGRLQYELEWSYQK